VLIWNNWPGRAMSMMAVFRWMAVFSILAMSGMFVGCGGGTGPELGYVSGHISMNGKPLENARVVFWLGHSRPSEGLTDSNGWYELRYTVNQDGALIGEHQVRISTAVLRADDTTTPEVIPDAYNMKSTLVREVKPGTNVFDFDIPK
jgi:hypothetical protein